MNKITWPEILVTGKEPAEYKDNPRRQWLLCADGLQGWAICSSGMSDGIPEKFGEGMAHIGTILGVCTGDQLIDWSNKNPVPEELKVK